AHGFENTQAKALHVRRVEPDVSDLQVVLDVGDLLAHDDAIGEAEATYVLGERRERLAPEHEELPGRARGAPCDRLEQEIDALPRPEIRGVDEKDLAAEPQLLSHVVARSAGTPRGEEIVDDLDRAGVVEGSLRLPFQRPGHCRDGVRAGER